MFYYEWMNHFGEKFAKFSKKIVNKNVAALIRIDAI